METSNYKNVFDLTEDEIMKKIGENLKTVRKNKSSYSQHKLSEKLKKSTSYINGIETAKSCFSIIELLNICNVLKCTPNEILAGLFPNRLKSLSTFYILPEKDQKLTESIIEFLFEYTQKSNDKK